jgi:hypothetical protein
MPEPEKPKEKPGIIETIAKGMGLGSKPKADAPKADAPFMKGWVTDFHNPPKDKGIFEPPVKVIASEKVQKVK